MSGWRPRCDGCEYDLSGAIVDRATGLGKCPECARPFHPLDLHTPLKPAPLLRDWLGAVLIPCALPLLATIVFLLRPPYADAWVLTGLILSPVLIALAIALPIRRWGRITRSHRGAKLNRTRLLWVYFLAILLNVAVLVASGFAAIWVINREFTNF